jgi:hypothetical protein
MRASIRIRAFCPAGLDGQVGKRIADLLASGNLYRLNNIKRSFKNSAEHAKENLRLIFSTSFSTRGFP